MNYTDKHIVESYSGLFEGLSTLNKIVLIENLSKSLKREQKTKESKFYKSFAAFSADKTAEVIIAEIKAARQFRNIEIKF